MSEEFKNLNKTIASFMLASFAISASTFAVANENLLADATGSAKISEESGMVRALYGVPDRPYIADPGRAMMKYGAPVDPSVTRREPPTQELYGVPDEPSIVKPRQVMMKYGAPIRPSDTASDDSSGKNNIDMDLKDTIDKFKSDYSSPANFYKYYLPDKK